jgi:DNA-binding XRE family transcriptional regulator
VRAEIKPGLNVLAFLFLVVRRPYSKNQKIRNHPKLPDQKKSQKWLAGQLGISTTAMTAICNNKSQPHLKDLRKIAMILDVDIRELLVPTK